MNAVLIYSLNYALYVIHVCKSEAEHLITASHEDETSRITFPHNDVIKWKHIPRYWPFAGNSPVSSEFPSQKSETRSFDVFFDLRLNKRLSKQSRRRWRHHTHNHVNVMNTCFQNKVVCSQVSTIWIGNSIPEIPWAVMTYPCFCNPMF